MVLGELVAELEAEEPDPRELNRGELVADLEEGLDVQLVRRCRL